MNSRFQVEGFRLASRRHDDDLTASELESLRRQVISDGGMNAEDAVAFIDAVVGMLQGVAVPNAEVDEDGLVIDCGHDGAPIQIGASLKYVGDGLAACVGEDLLRVWARL